ncbi:hypothetical protein [Vogesella oryzae]|uniref:hypothetical protein n=1 Tax=Vogesella oryzae TaxID=1735285 RepID=UPI0015826D23|nr:hypothetical protein [Vogesella oryzae]
MKNNKAADAITPPGRPGVAGSGNTFTPDYDCTLGSFLLRRVPHLATPVRSNLHSVFTAGKPEHARHRL